MQFRSVPNGAAVEFVWLDHASVYGWKDASNTKQFGPVRIATLGRVVTNDKYTITVSTTFDIDFNQVNTALSVLWSDIKQFRTLPKKYWLDLVE